MIDVTYIEASKMLSSQLRLWFLRTRALMHKEAFRSPSKEQMSEQYIGMDSWWHCQSSILPRASLTIPGKSLGFKFWSWRATQEYMYNAGELTAISQMITTSPLLLICSCFNLWIPCTNKSIMLLSVLVLHAAHRTGTLTNTCFHPLP